MEENKKRPLSEEELEQVAGGIKESTDDLYDNKKWRCKHCGKWFTVKEEAEEHEANCTGLTVDSKPVVDQKPLGLLKPIIL